MEEPSNQTIYALLLDFKEKNSGEHARIELKQDHTNGDITELKAFRNFSKGAIAVLTALIIPILLIVIREYVTR